MSKENIVQFVTDHQDEILKFYTDVISLESPTEYKEGVDAVGNYFIDAAKKAGFDVDVNLQPVSGNAVTISMNSDVDGEPIVLSGHMDTVHPLGAFGEKTCWIEDGVVHGPGSVDCKGGIVCGFFALLALKEAGYRERPVKLILQSDEENGSATSNKTTCEYIVRQSEGALAFLNLEGFTGTTLTVERKGIITFIFRVHGKATHASNILVDGASAILEASHKIIEIEKYKDSSFIVTSVGLIKGGSAVNTVPGECEFTVDVRINKIKDVEKVREIMLEIAKTSYVEGTTCDIEERSCRIPMERTEKNMLLFEKVRKIFEENGFEEVTPRKMGGGSDACYTVAAGIPTVCSIGIRGFGGGHTLKEAAKVEELYKGVQRLAIVVAELK